MNWIKKHKFWVGVVVLLATGFAVERLADAETVYTAIYWVAGVATATWLLFRLGKISSRSLKCEDKAKEAR